jgi:hypothetical protein
MNSDLNCLSLMELLDLRAGTDDPVAQEHLAACARCRTLLSTLPAKLELGQPVASPLVASRRESRRAPSGGVRSGRLWRAAPASNSDFSWVVAIIGRSPDHEDGLLVAPIADPFALATDRDLLLDRSVLGYDAFIDMDNLGTLLRRQLLEPVGELERPQAEAMIDLYRHILFGEEVKSEIARGLPVLDERDPRLLEQAARADALRALWRPALMLVDEDTGQQEHAVSPAAEPAAAVTPASRPLSAVLAEHLEGPSAEWDRASLLEESGIDGRHLDGFLGDHLQLTDKGDVRDLARVINILDLTWSEAEPAVVTSLRRSGGGTRSAEDPTLPMAARSRAGADPEQTTRDLYRDQSNVDTSVQARSREIALYVAELRRELDELE